MVQEAYLYIIKSPISLYYFRISDISERAWNVICSFYFLGWFQVGVGGAVIKNSTLNNIPENIYPFLHKIIPSQNFF